MLFRKTEFHIVLQKIVYALQNEANSALWTFGIIAINTCCSELFCYPKICYTLANLKTFNQFPYFLRELILCGVQGFLPSFNQLSMTPFTSIKLKKLPELEENCLNIKLLPSNLSTVILIFF